jgi:hypothetical protein
MLIMMIVRRAGRSRVYWLAACCDACCRQNSCALLLRDKRSGVVLRRLALPHAMLLTRCCPCQRFRSGECLRIKLLQLCVELLKAARPIIAANKALRDGLTKWTWKYLTVPEECPCRCACMGPSAHSAGGWGGGECEGGR